MASTQYAPVMGVTTVLWIRATDGGPDYTGPWPQMRDHGPTASIRGLAGIFPFRATVSHAPLSSLRKAMRATGDRLAVSEAPNPNDMWVWARTEDDANRASAAMPRGTVFAPHDGTGER
jgi:hypothetical protein